MATKISSSTLIIMKKKMKNTISINQTKNSNKFIKPKFRLKIKSSLVESTNIKKSTSLNYCTQLSTSSSSLLSTTPPSKSTTSSLPSPSSSSTLFSTFSLKCFAILLFKLIHSLNSHISSKTLFVYCCCLLGLITTKPVFGQNGHNGHCGDIKACTALFKNATMSNDLSYDLSRHKIETMCVTLNRSVECLENYKKSCLKENSAHLNYFDQTTEGSLGLTMELCNNPKFKDDYLTHGPCQKRHLIEFDRCLGHDQNTVTNNNVNNGSGSGSSTSSSNSTDLIRFIENCCALYNYHHCIYDISMDKCGKGSAEFSLKILEIFHRSSMQECAKHANLSQLCLRTRYLTSSATSSTMRSSGGRNRKTKRKSKQTLSLSSNIIEPNNSPQEHFNAIWWDSVSDRCYQLIKLISLIMIPVLLTNYYFCCCCWSYPDFKLIAKNPFKSEPTLKQSKKIFKTISDKSVDRRQLIVNDNGASTIKSDKKMLI